MFISLFKLECGPQEINFVGNWLTFNIENELDYLEWGKFGGQAYSFYWDVIATVNVVVATAF